MIKYLRLRNLATIEDIRIDWEDGFSVLTGETGAGKSIIIDGIRLVCGEKGSADLVRAGAEEASVEAIFARPAGAGRPTARTATSSFSGFSPEAAGKAYQDGVLVPVKKTQGNGRRADRRLRPERPCLSSPDRKPSGLPGPIRRSRSPEGGNRTGGPGASRPGPAARGMAGQGARARPAARFSRIPDRRNREGRPPARRRGRTARKAPPPAQRGKNPRPGRRIL